MTRDKFGEGETLLRFFRVEITMADGRKVYGGTAKSAKEITPRKPNARFWRSRDSAQRWLRDYSWMVPGADSYDVVGFTFKKRNFRP